MLKIYVHFFPSPIHILKFTRSPFNFPKALWRKSWITDSTQYNFHGSFAWDGPEEESRRITSKCKLGEFQIEIVNGLLSQGDPYDEEELPLAWKDKKAAAEQRSESLLNG